MLCSNNPVYNFFVCSMRNNIPAFKLRLHLIYGWKGMERDTSRIYKFFINNHFPIKILKMFASFPLPPQSTGAVITMLLYEQSLEIQVPL